MSTKKQLEVLHIITDHKDKFGAYPTLQQICQKMGIRSASSVHEHINQLADEGKLIKNSSYGSFELPDTNGPNYGAVPVVGYIAAGFPIEAIEHTNADTISIANLPKAGQFYALKVTGDSMIEEGIFDGDIVIVKKQKSAVNGQTVVAIINGNEATLKKYYKEKNRFRLQPANQKLLPLFTNELEIRGVVWEVRRKYAKATSTNSQGKTWKTLDLFAGIGGIRLGFERAGFKTVFANDFEAPCKATYDANFKDSKLVVEDITKIAVEDLPEFDFLLGGFPCQAFSIAGYRQGFTDEKGRGNLFFDIARILDERKPEGFLLENVKNLRTHDGGNTYRVIEETLKDLGYTVKSKVMNSMEYGNVPQNRERIYIVGFKDPAKTEAFDFPGPVELTKKITDILEPAVEDKYYYNGKPLFDRLKNDVNEVGEVYQWRRQYVRKNKKGVCPTLTANMGMGGHNVPIIYDGKGIRKLTPRECARIQGYSDDYVLPLNLPDSRLYKQIGNSVSVPVIERIAKKMQEVL
jgi:DNA (cytosine-5)-methyltransferase 1